MPIQIINQSKCLTMAAAMNLLMQHGGTLTGMPCHFASSPHWSDPIELTLNQADGSMKRFCYDMESRLFVPLMEPAQ